jgi:hypothetical protein
MAEFTMPGRIPSVISMCDEIARKYRRASATFIPDSYDTLLYDKIAQKASNRFIKESYKELLRDEIAQKYQRASDRAIPDYFDEFVVKNVGRRGSLCLYDDHPHVSIICIDTINVMVPNVEVPNVVVDNVVRRQETVSYETTPLNNLSRLYKDIRTPLTALFVILILITLLVCKLRS